LAASGRLLAAIGLPDSEARLIIILMRGLVLLLLLAAVAVVYNSSGTHQSNAIAVAAHSDNSAQPKIDFLTQVKPIFEARCQPCHFSGGKVYDKMPFDRAETIKRLGTKLFTRIKDEKEQLLIRQFLVQN
jgi:hypothetical protein